MNRISTREVWEQTVVNTGNLPAFLNRKAINEFKILECDHNQTEIVYKTTKMIVGGKDQHWFYPYYSGKDALRAEQRSKLERTEG